MRQIKGGQTHSDTDRMNKLEPQTRIYSKVLKMSFQIWNVYSFIFNHFYISSFWIGQLVQVNKHCNIWILKRLFLLVSLHDQYHWFCQQCQSQSSIHFFSHLALTFHYPPFHTFSPQTLLIYIILRLIDLGITHIPHFWILLHNPTPKSQTVTFVHVDSNEQTRTAPNAEIFKRTNTVFTR